MANYPLPHVKKARFTTAIFFILAGLLAASWSSRIPDLQRHLGVNNAIWGTVLFALPAGFVGGIAVASWLTTRLGPHRIIIAGGLIASILLYLLGVASTVIQLMITLFFVGFVRTVFNIALNTQAVDVQRHYQQPILSLFHGLWSLACFAAIGIATVMIWEKVAPAFHFLGIAAICITCILLFRHQPALEKAAPADKRPFFVKPDKYLLLLGLIAFCAMLCESTIFDWSVNYFSQVIKTEKGLATSGYTAFIISMATGRLFGDRLIEKWGPFTLLKINSVLMGSGFLLAAFIPELVPAAIGLVLVGLGDSVIVPIVYNLSSQTKKMPSSYALSAVTMIGYAGFLTGPILVGIISEWFTMQWAWAIVGLICFSIAGLSLLVQAHLTRAEKE
jgi:fucose permease